MTSRWDTTQIPDLSGKTAIVTGGNGGIGYEAALELARKGATVWIAARNPQKSQQAHAQILRAVPDARVQVHPLDLGDLRSVQSFAAEFNRTSQPLDLLLNNAGVMALPKAFTHDGFEQQIGINHFGHFALTGLLLPAILAAPAARVVTVSSSLHRRGVVKFDDLNWKQTNYSRWGAYQRSKLANLLFAFELQRRFQQAGAKAISVAAHPGYSATNLQALPAVGVSALERWALHFSLRFAQSQAMGALPTLYAATAPGLRGGEYIGPGGWMEIRGYPRIVNAAAPAHSKADAARLWQASEALTHVQYEVLERAKAV